MDRDQKHVAGRNLIKSVWPGNVLHKILPPAERKNFATYIVFP